jgi:hypothetical protein
LQEAKFFYQRGQDVSFATLTLHRFRIRSFENLLAQQKPIITAGLRPELFVETGAQPMSRAWLIFLLTVFVVAGFGFRIKDLSAESLSEDELNKLNAVLDYRAHGLTSANGEHPLLMKALQTGSLVAAERWNAGRIVNESRPTLLIPVETALRLPSVIFGSLSVIVLYLVASELFGMEAALIAGALWAFDPSAIAFSRIAKEDVFFLFFFLLANTFWLRGQRIAEGDSGRNPQPYYWATGAALGAMLASKYILFFIAISVSYNYIFQGLPTTHWVIGKKRYLTIFTIMGVVFLLCNPTILLPGTWHEMLAFASSKKIGHDSYEFMGKLYSHRVTDWLGGVPWYFYFVFIGIKTPIPTLIAFLAGIPLLFRRKLGDGRFFLFFWIAFGFIPFCLVGGKFTRYFTTSLPIVFITSALGIQFISRWIMRQLTTPFANQTVKNYLRPALALLMILSSIQASMSAAPYYRLYNNTVGGGISRAGYYFPHDDFYDASIGRVMSEIAQRARYGARVLSETPGLADYYAKQANRYDLRCISLSDPMALAELEPGDFIVAARGRRYFSNEELLSRLQQSTAPSFQIFLGGIPAADVYLLDQASLAIIMNSK